MYNLVSTCSRLNDTQISHVTCHFEVFEEFAILEKK